MFVCFGFYNVWLFVFVNHVIENAFFTFQVATATCHSAEAQKLRSVAQRRKTYIDGISACVAKKHKTKQTNITYS